MMIVLRFRRLGMILLSLATSHCGRIGFDGASFEGPFGAALAFDGVDDRVVTALVAPSDYVMTVELWVKFGSLKPANFIGTAGNSDWAILIHEDQIKGGFGLPAADAFIVADVLVSVEKWYHIALAGDGSVATMYINAEEVGSAPISRHIADATVFGDGSWGGIRHADVVLDEIRIWSERRTQEQIRIGMEAEIHPSTPGLLAYWPMNEGAGQRVEDVSGHGYQGTLGNASSAGTDDPAWVGGADPW